MATIIDYSYVAACSGYISGPINVVLIRCIARGAVEQTWQPVQTEQGSIYALMLSCAEYFLGHIGL